jgi:hypothetical protein
MNHVLAFPSRALAFGNSAPGQFSDYMLFELLAMHEELIGQLRLECQVAGSNTDFLADLINQHEQAVILLRTLIENH